MTRSRVWQKSLFSSNSNSGCDNVFGDDPKPMHQSCWLVDRKAFSVLHVSHFEFQFYFSPPYCQQKCDLCFACLKVQHYVWIYQYQMDGNELINILCQKNVMVSFQISRIYLASLLYMIMYSKDRHDSIQCRIDTCVHFVPLCFKLAFSSLLTSSCTAYQWIKFLPIYKYQYMQFLIIYNYKLSFYRSFNFISYFLLTNDLCVPKHRYMQVTCLNMILHILILDPPQLNTNHSL